MDAMVEVEDLSDRLDQVDASPIYAGPYSRVYRGFLKDGKCVAVKVLQPTSGQGLHVLRRKILREKTVWAMLDHPNILLLHGYAEEDSRFQPLGALISPWCEYGNATAYLSQYGEQLDEYHRVDLWRGVIRGVEYLHLYNPCIVHGDLKPANVLIDGSGSPKICDFGLVKLFMDSGQTGFTTTSEHTGTVRYLSPELVAGEPVSTASDVYALGCIGSEFIFGLIPYHKRVNCRPWPVLCDISMGVPPVERPSDLDSHLEGDWSLIESCLHRDPTKRPFASDLLPTEFPRVTMDNTGVEDSAQVRSSGEGNQDNRDALIKFPPSPPPQQQQEQSKRADSPVLMSGFKGNWPKPIFFHNESDPHYGFTNFSPYPVMYRGKRYPTSEHAFQAHKFMPHRPLLAEHIRTHSANPTDAFNEASRFQPEIRPDWEGCQYEKMYDILLEKFSQHPKLKQELMGTGDSELVEDSPMDWFWGIGADRKGENQLGLTLMCLRNYFQSNPLKEPETNG